MLTHFGRPALVMALACFLFAGVSVTPAVAETTQIDFGDDSGDFINDGECDDVRFEGDGATVAGAPKTDAADCRALYEAGAISLRASMNEGLALPEFGDDSGNYANDGDCDDPRFDGPRSTTLGTAGSDATDCRTLWELGLLIPRASLNEGLEAPDFGDDSGEYANDGDCDDPRFEGSRTTMLGAPGTDAADCRALWEQGLIAPRAPLNEGLGAPDFGDDSGQFANDGECDDPRFEGPGASSVGTERTDATDCSAAWAAGTITLAPEVDPADNPYNIVFDGIVFGDNSSSWANDSECDDPRFAGEGMASVLADDDQARDATDCLVLYARGQITLKE